jgi:hypothetical protein
MKIIGFVVAISLFWPVIGICASADFRGLTLNQTLDLVKSPPADWQSKAVVIPRYRGAMKGAKPTLYKLRHPKNPKLGEPQWSSKKP